MPTVEAPTARIIEAGLLTYVLLGACQPAVSQAGGNAAVRSLLSRALPAMKGESLKVTVVEVEYPPAGSSAAHRHPCAVIGYVVTGAFHSRSEGGPDSVYQAGQTFYEPPNATHLISANASTTERVRFTATFICDTTAPLTSPVSGK